MNNKPVLLTSPVQHYEEAPDDPSFTVFTFSWLHIPTSTTGSRSIWTRNRKDFLEILNHWNRQKDWKYVEYFLS